MDGGVVECGLPISLKAVRDDLLKAYADCQTRGLVQTTKWLGDLYFAVDMPESCETGMFPDQFQLSFRFVTY